MGPSKMGFTVVLWLPLAIECVQFVRNQIGYNKKKDPSNKVE